MMNSTHTVTDNNGIYSVIGGGGDVRVFESGGVIDEGGFINNLTKKGFTKNRCLAELIGNSDDAEATKCQLIVECDKIKIIDNGWGMYNGNISSEDTEDGPSNLHNMFSMYRENHRNKKKTGTSGIGAKAALYNLSKGLTCYVYTRTEHGEYRMAKIPWPDIIEQGKWTGLV